VLDRGLDSARADLPHVYHSVDQDRRLVRRRRWVQSGAPGRVEGVLRARLTLHRDLTRDPFRRGLGAVFRRSFFEDPSDVNVGPCIR
jgi:hypothetical protein